MTTPLDGPADRSRPVRAGFKPARGGGGRADRRPNSLRLPGFDYSLPGAYFITICTLNRLPLFEQSSAKVIVEAALRELPAHYAGVVLDEFVVMPNHVHAILILSEECRTSLSEIIRGFKTFSSRRLNAFLYKKTAHVWQRNYYEHVIRNDEGLARIQEYIRANPERWHEDHENPDGVVGADERNFWWWVETQGAAPTPLRAGLKPARASYP